MVCSINMALNWLKMTYCYNHKRIHLSVIVREAFVFSMWVLKQRFISSQGTKNKIFRCDQPQVGHLYHLPSSQSSNIISQEEMERFQSWRDWMTTRMLWRHNNFTYELTVAMIICIRPAQNQGRQGPHGEENCQKVSSLSEVLLAIDGFWQKES